MLKEIKKNGNSACVILDTGDMKCLGMEIGDVINIEVTTAKELKEIKRQEEEAKRILAGKAEWHPSDTELLRGDYRDNFGYIEKRLKQLTKMGVTLDKNGCPRNKKGNANYNLEEKNGR